MAIISCPNCRKQISSRVTICPYCDTSFLDTHIQSKSKASKRHSKLFLVVSVLMVIIPILYIIASLILGVIMGYAISTGEIVFCMFLGICGVLMRKRLT